ncbi:MAG: hypothetical protein KZQ85_16375 [Candidatus Thiodiazotropha sp. (ex Myrtea sp. 'scaly one' KF741663)]|nr:hypothetical protein [Candidatus Thiodiazotropha sp. (ex Myrtea sp. 'scaly one' KF741663)]
MIKVLITGIACGTIGWWLGAESNSIDWTTLEESQRQELYGQMHLDYQPAQMRQLKIGDSTVVFPSTANSKSWQFIHVITPSYTASLSELFATIRFGAKDSVSVSDLNRDGAYEQLENTFPNEQGVEVSLVDRNRDGVVDVAMVGEEVVSSYDASSNKRL